MKNDYKNAQLLVTDNAGKTIETIDINDKSGKMVFDASSLPAGMYYYSLRAEGKILVTKTMILNK